MHEMLRLVRRRTSDGLKAGSGLSVVVLALTTSVIAGGCSRTPTVSLYAPVAASVQTGVGAAPVLTVSRSGRRALAWVSAPDGGTDGRLYVSVDDRPPVEIRDTLGPVQARGEAPPKLAFDTAGVLHALYVVGRMVPGRKYPLSAMRHVSSADSGRSWSEAGSVTDLDIFGSYNFQALHVAANGVVYASWLDGREGKSATYFTRSADGGHTWAPNQRVAAGQSCPCCRTAIATDGAGDVFIAWRSVMEGNIRDIVVAHSADGGAHFGAPVRVHADNWSFNACPEAGPSIQIDRNHALHVAWWTGVEGKAGVYYATSVDRGQSFAAPLALSAAEFSKPSHVQLALGDSGLVAALWDDGTLKVPTIKLRVSQNGGRSFAREVQISADRQPASFPMLNLNGRTLTMAWSEQRPSNAAPPAHDMSAMNGKPMVHGLTSVGDSHIMMRRGVVQ